MVDNHLDDAAAHGPVSSDVMAQAARLAVGVDVGGTGVKAGLVDLTSGVLIGPPVRLTTPNPALLAAVIDVVEEAVGRLEEEHPEVRPFTGLALGVGLSGDVRDGRHTTGVNLHPSWVDAPARDLLEARLGRSVHIVNDADAAGIAEARYGAGIGVSGVVVLLTLGTGIGSAILLDGRLLPNSGLGQFPFHGNDAESSLSAVSRERRGISWQQWAVEFSEFLCLVDGMLRPNLIILGGGGGDVASAYWAYLRSPCRIVPAALGNMAGIVGAATIGCHGEGARLPRDRVLS
jgi:polyphosphate glucokinase